MINGIRNDTNYQNMHGYTKQPRQHMPEEKEKPKESIDLGVPYKSSTQSVTKQGNVILTLHSQQPQEEKSAEPAKAEQEGAFLRRFMQFIAKYAAALGVPVQEDKPVQVWYQNVRERVRIQFESIRNSLSKFLKQDEALQMDAGSKDDSKEKEKENENKLSAFSGSGVEVQPGVVNDSHLLDSYDRRGNYSKIGKS